MSAYKKQVGGSHYKDMAIQPADFINKNKLLFAEGNAIKYICRHQSKGELQDIEKAIHYLEMIRCCKKRWFCYRYSYSYQESNFLFPYCSPHDREFKY